MQPVAVHGGNAAYGEGDTQASGTKWRILSAAEEVISEKGLARSSISEIARKAGVADSVIYQHFKGKQDLLFSVPGERMKEVLALLVEQLTSIQDVQSRLRKMIWFHLRYNELTKAMRDFCSWSAAHPRPSMKRPLTGWSANTRGFSLP